MKTIILIYCLYDKVSFNTLTNCVPVSVNMKAMCCMVFKTINFDFQNCWTSVALKNKNTGTSEVFRELALSQIF